MDRCNYCGWYFVPGETIHTSKLNGANGVQLCEEDAEREDNLIALHGTKTLPQLLSTYTLGRRGRAQL